MTAESNAAAGGVQPAEYFRLWAEQFSHALGQIMDAATSCVARSEAPADFAAGEQDLWAFIVASGGLRGEMSLRIPAASALRLAQISLKESSLKEPASAETQLTPEHKNALLELLRQIAALMVVAAKPHWGEMQLHVEMAAAAPSWPFAEAFWLQIGEGPEAMFLEAGLSAALVAELRAEKEKSATAKAQSAPASTNVDGSAPAGAIDVLMDVQLGVSMHFGSRRLLLREVLELSPGAVIELDRRVQEPVDLLLDGRLIARGEVVVIDGNYGLRVTDVSPLALPTGAVPKG
jgi:flagellar motor switch protein FliN